MKSILTDLIDANFEKVYSENDESVYTLLPLTGKKENEKIRCVLTLLYTALYFENVVLLNKLLNEEINFGDKAHDLLLCLLNKAMDLYNRCPVFATSSYSHCSAEILRDIDNDILIELNDKVDLRGEPEYIKIMAKKVKLKRLIKNFQMVIINKKVVII